MNAHCIFPLCSSTVAVVHYEVLQYEKGKLTLHVHIRRLVHEMHEELRSVDENLVSAVSNGAIPPRSL